MEVSGLLSGVIAGCVATAPMSLTMKAIQLVLPAHESYALPPAVITFNAAIKSGHLPTSQEEHTILTLLAHFGAGAGFGLFYGLGAAASKKPRNGLIRGSIFGLLVWSLNYLGIMPALNLHHSAEKEPVRRNALMIIAHLVYGLTTDQVFRRLQPILKKRLS
jgi:uncharacterized membrane protein YagU involved in acid resistance